MKPKFKTFIAGATLVTLSSLHAQTWNAAVADFRVGTNWSPATVPGAGSTAFIRNSGTATIGAGPDLDVGSLSLGGDGSGSANESGNLTVRGAILLISTSLDSHSIIGNVAQNPNTVVASVLRMDSGEIQVDDPTGAQSGKIGLSRRFDYTNTGSNTWDTSGLNNKDLLIGSGSRGRLEMHNNARLYLGDDLGLANNGTATSQYADVVMDGDSFLSIGSGTEVGKTNATVNISLSGNAKFISGNSLGPGNLSGHTDEGYFTVGTRDSGSQTINIADQAELQCMTLQNRLGNTQFNLTGNAKLKVYNVYSGSGTIVATRPSYISSGQPSNTLISLRNSSSMLVDCIVGNEVSGGPNMVNGLHVGGGENLQSGDVNDVNTYQSTDGGTAVLDVADSAILDIRQGLHLGFGRAATSDATLRITGPDATVSIGGNLNLAFNEYVESIEAGAGARSGTAVVEHIITGPTQTPITVGGAARITNGTLKIVLNGYTPPCGTSYTLISAGSVAGPFRDVDLTQAPLGGDDVWKIDTTATKVTATVCNPFLSISADATSATLTWPGSATLQFSPDLVTPFADIPAATSPFVTPLDAPKKFFRLRY